MSTIAKIDDQNYSFSKGAPDFMIKHCSKYIDKNGKEVPINENFIK